jgi:hypothetical protein
MTPNNSGRVCVRLSKDCSLGETMSTIREWMDGQNIGPSTFRSSVDARGYALTISFQTLGQAERFREYFRKVATLI